jgi:hypothetical protein
LAFDKNPFDPSVIGQLIFPNDGEPCCNGLGRESDLGIYEGQYIEDEWNGYGRRIIANGDYYIGFWKDGMRNGHGKYVYNRDHKVEEGEWLDDEFRGN